MKLLKQPAARRPTSSAFRSPVVGYHGRGHRYLLPRGILLRPLLGSGPLGGRSDVPMLEEFQSAALRKIDVSVLGEWRQGKTRDWRGEARSVEPVVAVAFCRQGVRISWCKSERANPAGQAVRLLLGHYDASGRDVQVSFSVGQGHVRSRTVLDSPEYLPMIMSPIIGPTGAVLPFATVEGSSQVDLSVLFLAGSDVKVGRNGLWHLRSDLVGSVPNAFRELVAHGRTGTLNAA